MWNHHPHLPDLVLDKNTTLLLSTAFVKETHQEAAKTPDVPQRQGDVDEHGGVADQDGGDVAVALSIDLVLDAALRVEGDREVWVAVIF